MMIGFMAWFEIIIKFWLGLSCVIKPISIKMDRKHLIFCYIFDSRSTLGVTDSTPRKRAKKLFAEEAAEVKEKRDIDVEPEIRNLVVSSGQMITCLTCQSSVNRSQFGKHLISHYHHHKSMGHPENKQLALDFIEDIVKEAPFQCQICQFYCNWNHEFIHHWSGEHHITHDKVRSTKVGGAEVYWCSFCRYTIFIRFSLWFGYKQV